VVECRHPPGERVRRLERGDAGDAEPEVLCHGRHHGNDEHRVVDRDLRGGAHGRVGSAAVDVVDAEDVGEEHRVEAPALERLG